MTEGNYFSVPKDFDFEILKNGDIENFNSDAYKEILAEYISAELHNKLDFKTISIINIEN